MAQVTIAVIGAGGKTTAMKLLARNCGRKSTLITTTTHIFPMQPPDCDICLVEPTAEQLTAALGTEGTVCAGRIGREEKLSSLSQNTLTAGMDAAELVIYEADGAHGRPLKLHQKNEPVMLPDTDVCLIVAGLSAIGKPLQEVIHRWDLNAHYKRSPGRIVGPEEVLFCIQETISASKMPQGKIRILLNQADCIADPERIDAIISPLSAAGYSVQASSLHENPGFLSQWLL